MKRIGLVAAIALLAGGCSAPPSLVGDGSDFAAMTARARAGVVGQLAVDGVPNGTMSPGKASTWTLTFTEGGRPIRGFELHHDRTMHLVIVRQDLSTFAHLHPTLGRDGTFTVRVGAPSADPDERDALRAVAEPGTYFVFAEVTPQGRPSQLARFTVTVKGTAKSAAFAVDREPVRYLTAEGAAGKVGDPYRVRFNLDRGDPSMPTLEATVEERRANGQYVGVSDLQPWLGMAGHSIWVGAKGAQVGDKAFVHAHAMGGMDHGMMGHVMAIGPTLSFMLMGDEVPPAGMYRVWTQFKVHGRVMTVPYTLQL